MGTMARPAMNRPTIQRATFGEMSVWIKPFCSDSRPENDMLVDSAATVVGGRVVVVAVRTGLSRTVIDAPLEPEVDEIIFSLRPHHHDCNGEDRHDGRHSGQMQTAREDPR